MCIVEKSEGEGGDDGKQENEKRQTKKKREWYEKQ